MKIDNVSFYFKWCIQFLSVNLLRAMSVTLTLIAIRHIVFKIQLFRAEVLSKFSLFICFAPLIVFLLAATFLIFFLLGQFIHSIVSSIL